MVKLSKQIIKRQNFYQVSKFCIQKNIFIYKVFPLRVGVLLSKLLSKKKFLRITYEKQKGFFLISNLLTKKQNLFFIYLYYSVEKIITN